MNRRPAKELISDARKDGITDQSPKLEPGSALSITILQGH